MESKIYINTSRLKNAYWRCGNVMYIDHWFNKMQKVYGMYGNQNLWVSKETKVIDKNRYVLKHNGKQRACWFVPVMQLEKRFHERLDMHKVLEHPLVWSPHTRLPKEFSPHSAIEVEKLARKKPDRDWRIEIMEPFESAVYQRQGRNKWMLVELGKGYA